MANRVDNWPALLAEFIRRKKAEPFAWGKNDCCLFVCDWVHDLTGVDPASDLGLRGAYETHLHAAKILAERGGLEAIFADYAVRQGWPECKPLKAQRGDVVIADTEDGPAAGVCIGAVGLFQGKGQLTTVNLRNCKRAWRIG